MNHAPSVRKYPERVFYTRKWRDPEGKEFGKGLLRICSRAAFVSLTKGYRHPFELRVKAIDRTSLLTLEASKTEATPK